MVANISLIQSYLNFVICFTAQYHLNLVSHIVVWQSSLLVIITGDMAEK